MQEYLSVFIIIIQLVRCGTHGKRLQRIKHIILYLSSHLNLTKPVNNCRSSGKFLQVNPGLVAFLSGSRYYLGISTGGAK